MSRDTVHTIFGMLSMLLIAGGAAGAWGWGYAALITGCLLLSGVIYARVSGISQEEDR